jgi:trk system potassium uptake protein TrkA
MDPKKEVRVRVVIVGIGDIGRNLAETISRHEKGELILIDVDEKRCEQLAAEVDALVLHGDGTNPDILKKARMAEADALVAVTGSDALNTVIAMLGHRLGVRKIIVKLNDVGLRAACQEIGVTKIIAPKISASVEILASLHGFGRLDFSLVVHGGLRMVEMGVGQAAGKRLSELAMPESVLVVAVLRGDRVVIPRGQTKLEENDVLMVLVENENLMDKLRKILGTD